jgi:hypothetical protein
MKYFSLLLVLLLAFSACGKKTDPVSKDRLENHASPSAYTVTAAENGITITNSEDGSLIVEKAYVSAGACSQYTPLTVIEPKASFTDTDTIPNTEYRYRLVKKTPRFGFISQPVVHPITYSVPPSVIKADYSLSGDNVILTVTPSKPFIRMDVFSGGTDIKQTAKKTAVISRSSVVSDTVSIQLTDRYANKGAVFTLPLTKLSRQNPPEKVTGLYAVLFENAVRIVWDSKPELTYTVTICDNVSCETVNSALPYVIYKKEFDKCINITVNAQSSGGTSADTTTTFCRK